MPVRRRAMRASSIAASGSGPAPRSGSAAARAEAPLAGLTTGASAKVFQASHDGQRPSQRADSNPHAVQKWTVWPWPQP